MNANRCTSCGHEFQEWVEFCPNCAEPIEDYSRPAGFWIRLGAWILDILVFIPIIILTMWNSWSLKNTTVLVLVTVPGFVYKPLMESLFGATVGKMACKIKVVDADGKKLSLAGAYVRHFPWLVSNGVGLAGQLILFSSERFQSATSVEELQLAQQENFLAPISAIVFGLVLIECIFAAFTFRKRALHDMLAESFCVYKEPGALRPEPSNQ